MKRRLIPFLLLVFTIVCLVGLASCGGNAYKVEFYDGDALLYTRLVPKGGSLEDIPDVPEKSGFVGEWSVNDFDEIDKNQKVFAIYTKSQYTVSFFVDDALFTTRTVNRNSRLSNVPAVPEKPGYRGEWSVIDFSLIDRDIDVHAAYTAAAITVTFVVDGETYFVSEAEDGALSYVPDVPAAFGKDLSAKWSLDESEAIEPDFSSVSDSLTVYAHYYVTLKLVGGNKQTLTAEIDEEIPSPAASPVSGSDFLGWYADEAYSYPVSFPRGFSENTTLYARRIKNSFSEGFTFADGALTGYYGESSTPVAPYKYTDPAGQEVLVTKVAARALEGSDLTAITLPSTVTEIGDNAFHNAYFLTAVDFSDGSFVEKIGEQAFCECRALKKFVFSSFTDFIGEAAFYNCRALSSYGDLEKTKVVNIYADTFYENLSVASFRLPETLEEVGEYAFYSNEAEFSFLGSKIRSVGRGAFSFCRRLRVFEQPALTAIGEGAFLACGNLTFVTTTSDRPVYTLFGESEGAAFYAVSAPVGSRTYYLPKGLRSVLVTPNLRTDTTAAGTLVTNAFWGTTSVKSVTISAGIKVIKERAFACSAETGDAELTVQLPAGLTEIGESAFADRTDLTEISLPATVATIGDNAFFGLYRLSDVTLPQNSALTTVGEYAFLGTPWFNSFPAVVKLGRVAIGVSDRVAKYELTPEDFSGTDRIAPKAFLGDMRLTKIALPEQIGSIGDEAFANAALREISLNAACVPGETILAGCNELKSLTLGASLRVEELFGKDSFPGGVSYSHGGETYYLPATLTELTVIADETTEISSDAYCGLSTLEKVVLGEGITSVCDGAFSLDPALTSISFPSTLLSVGGGFDEEDVSSAQEIFEGKTGVFSGSENLSVVTFAAGSKLEIVYGKAFFGTAVSSMSLPASVKKVGAYAFADTRLTFLSFADGEGMEIGDYAFALSSGADSFEFFSLRFPAGLTTIGKYAFAGRSGITAVEFDENLSKIGDGAFSACSISAVTLPSSAETDGEEVPVGIFKDAPVMDLTVSRPYTMAALFGGVPTYLDAVRVLGGEISDGEFSSVESLSRVELYDVVSIGEEAFAGCVGLTGVTIPATVEEIGDRAFYGCTGLRACVFENGSRLQKLGEYAFAEDVELAETVLPDSLSEENDLSGVFSGCVSLEQTNIPVGLTSIGERAFYNCSALRSIAIPEGVKSIGKEAFYGCETMEFENVRFDDLVEIGESAFAGCELLHAVKAESIRSIGSGAFFGCSDLKEITLASGKVTDVFDLVENVLSVNLSSACVGVESGAFVGCMDMISVTVYADAETVNTVLESIRGQERYGAKVFVKSASFGAVSAENSAAFGDDLLQNPSDLDAEYVYDDESETATLTSVGSFSHDVLYLPARIEREGKEYEVVAIGQGVFKNNLSIKEIIVPYTVSSIGDYAFEGCENVKSLRFEIGSRLETIGKKSFARTTGLSYIDLPDSLREIGQQAFEYSGLVRIDNTINSRLSTIGQYAFYRTENLQELSLLGVIEDIGEHAFEYSGIQSIHFGERARITEIKAYVFAQCYNLTDETIAYITENYVTDERAFARL